MKRLIEKLMDRFGPEKHSEPNKPLWQTDAFQKAKLEAARRKATPPRPRNKPQPNPPQSAPKANYTTTAGGKIADGGPGKNVFVREETGTHETLKIMDENLLDQIEEDGIDPYNTGRFDRSKSWDSSRFRK